MFILLPWPILLFLLNVFAPPLVSDAFECGYKFVATDLPKTIDSPNYPNLHQPNFSICEYTIVAYNEIDIIVLKVVNVSLHGSDTFEFHDEAWHNLDPVVFIFNQGSYRDEEYIIPSKVAIVKFNFNMENASERRFSILYYAAPPLTKANKFVALYWWKDIESPNHPRPYPSNMVKIYSIVADNHTSVLILKPELCLLANNIDYIKVYKNNIINISTIEITWQCPELLNKKETPDYYLNATGKDALVVFYSDSSEYKTARGFQIRFGVAGPGFLPEANCSSNLTATDIQQKITSLRYPLDVFIPNSNTCKFSITTNNPNNIIILKIVYLSLQNNDTLKFQGEQSNTFYLSSHQAPLQEGEYIIPDQEAIVEFEFGTDFNIGRKFFILYYSALPTTKADKFVAEESWSIITSPNFPNEYPSNLLKIYSISTNPNVANLKFQIMDCSLNNHSDYMKIYSGRIINSLNLIFNENCPTVLPYEFNVSLNEALLIVFHSDYRVFGANLGFKLGYAMLAVENSENNCGSTFTTKDNPQIFSSPGYPRYSTNTPDDCIYTITAHDSQYIIVFKFIDFEFPSDNLLRFQAVGKYYFVFSNSSQTNGEFIIPHNEATVEIFGFGKLRFSISYNAAPTILHAQQFVASTSWLYFTSPNYPEPYPLNMVKLYRVVADNPKPILFKMEACDVDNDYDFIKVYKDHVIIPSQLVLIVNCSNVMPYAFNVTHSEVIIVFNSDFQSAKSGFKLGYSTTN